MDIPEHDSSAAPIALFDNYQLNPDSNTLSGPFLSGSMWIAQAFTLRTEFGDDAAAAAALRAAHSRSRDNPYSYCQWREVERLMAWLDTPDAAATRH